jgi:hypothetical protein
MNYKDKFKTFISPAGFIEQHFLGNQTPDSVIGAIDELIKGALKLKANKEPILILVSVTEVSKIDISGKMAHAHEKAVDAMKRAEYDRIAIYGSMAVQLMVNTLVLIAGKRHKIRVFDSRLEALKWLKSGQ